MAKALLVANGPSAVTGDLAHREDEFDLIVRMNTWRPDTQTVGTRCDLWSMSISTAVLIPHLIARQRYRVQPQAFLVLPDSTKPPGTEVDLFYQAIRTIYHYDVDVTIAGWARVRTGERLIGKLPTLGTLTLLWFLGRGYDLTIHGYDLLHGDDCPDSYYWESSTAGVNGTMHDYPAEGRYIWQLIDAGAVKLFNPDAYTHPSQRGTR